MVQQHLCTCTTHQCNTHVTSAGTPGVLVDARTLRNHAKADLREQVRATVMEARKAAMKDNQERLVAAVKRLPPLATSHASSPNPIPTCKRTQYRIDHAQKMVSHIAVTKDEISFLLADAQLVGKPSEGSSARIVADALSRLEDLELRVFELEHRLSDLSRKSKEPSVIEMRDSTQEDIHNALSYIRSLQPLWHDAQVAHEAQRKADQQRGIVEYDTAHHFALVLGGASAIIQLVALMVIACHVLLGLPRRGSYWLFSMVQYIIQTTVERVIGSRTFPDYFKNLLSKFPRDIRSATKEFRLDGKATIYAACPGCHATYRPRIVDDIPVYPERCNFHHHGFSCKQILVRPTRLQQREVNVPIVPYITFDVKDWVAGLLSREGYERIMDGAWKNMTLPPDGMINNVFQGSAVRNFKGPDGKHFSESGGEGTGRYLFALAFDFFNPLGNKVAGKRISVSMLSIVCLNLPLEMRYQPENMFLAGIIPGPKEPTLDSINPYLRPIVDAFLEFWKGVRFTKTCLYEDGRLVYGAIILVIGDAPAARKIAGFASHAHTHYCWRCRGNLTTQGFNNFDIPSWVSRTNAEWRQHADEFHSARDPVEATRTFNNTGFRWSELLRLPYYEPTMFLVVEPMHCLFLGLIKEHFLGVLGSTDLKDVSKNKMEWLLPIDIPADPSNPLPEGRSQEAAVRKLKSELSKSLGSESLDSLIRQCSVNVITKAALIYVGRGLGVFSANLAFDSMKKRDLVVALANWRKGQRDAVAVDAPGSVLTAEEFEEIQKDVERTVKPTWLSSARSTIGRPGPKLKSDEWRTVGSVYLPILLVHLWSKSAPTTQDEQRRHDLMHLTMLLSSAINIATSRTTSESNAALYLLYMVAYRQELQRLFPTYACHSNHHMALHIPEFLLSHGPVHGWWAYPFERLVGMLQRISTNYKEGEYEVTIGRSWHRSSNFRAFFKKAACPLAIKFCAEMFYTLVHHQAQRTNQIDDLSYEDDLLNDTDAQESYTEHHQGREQDMSYEMCEALRKQWPTNKPLPWKANFIARIESNGVRYSTSKTHEGNSGVFVDGVDAPCYIESIMHVPGTDKQTSGPWLFVRALQDAGVTYEPYHKYPHLRARMWSPSPEHQIYVVPVDAVKSHFAKCIIPWEGKNVAVIVDLSRNMQALS